MFDPLADKQTKNVADEKIGQAGTQNEPPQHEALEPVSSTPLVIVKRLLAFVAGAWLSIFSLGFIFTVIDALLDI